MEYRVSLYDNLKAIGIILVVLGHVTEHGILVEFIYSFHMPLFFFISGMLYKEREGYAQRQARSIMWPYYVFAILSFAYWALIEVRMRPVPEGTSIAEQFTNIFYPINLPHYAHLMNVVLWFLPALFLCSMIYHYVIRRLESMFTPPIVCIVAIVTIAVTLQLYDFYLPLCIPQALAALPFFILGHMLDNRMRTLEDIQIKLRIPAYILSCSVFLLLWLYPTGGGMRGANYPMGYVPYLLGAMSCILSLCIICPKKYYQVFCFLGKNSLAIMVLHEPLKRIVIKVYSLILNMDMDVVRESLFHSITITIIVLALLSPVVVALQKYSNKLFRI